MNKRFISDASAGHIPLSLSELVAKITLSHWLRNVQYSPNQEVVNRIKAGPARSAALRNRVKRESILLERQRALRDVKQLTQRDLFMLGIGLYIGEGSKEYESTRLINSDAHVITLAMRWFREICHLQSENFFIAMHLYPDIDRKAALKHWSRLTGIPSSQFGITQIDRRPKSPVRQRKLPYGTVHVTVRSNGDRQKGVQLHRRIIGWIQAVYKLAGVV